MKKKLFTFTIMLLTILGMYGCKKETPSPLSYTSKMVGIRDWHGTITNHQIYTGVDTTINENFSFAITVINDTSISVNAIENNVGVVTLIYMSSGDSVIQFEGQNFKTLISGTRENIKVTYNYVANSIIYQETGGNPGPYSWNIILYTP